MGSDYIIFGALGKILSASPPSKSWHKLGLAGQREVVRGVIGAAVRPNYAIKPTPELYLRSSRALLPARLIAALGLNAGVDGKFDDGELALVLRLFAYLAAVICSVICNTAGSVSLVNTCSDTVAGSWKKSDSILWVTGSSAEDRIWMKRGAEPKLLVSPPGVPKACAYVAFVDDEGKQFFPCIGWASGLKVPSESILVSRALNRAEDCGKKCTAKLSDDIFVAYGTAKAGNPINLSLTSEQRREWMLEALERERAAFPEFEIRLDESGLPECFVVSPAVLRTVLGDTLP